MLPGGTEPFNLLKNKLDLTSLSILVMGSSCQEVARMLAAESGTRTELIVEDYESLMASKLELGGDESVRARMMSFEHTDFDPDSFDLLFSQGSFSVENRKSILKEVKRILKPGGILCVSEISKLKEEVPAFVSDIFERDGINPLFTEELSSYYTERGFEIVLEEDLTKNLRKFYTAVKNSLERQKRELSDEELKHSKKLRKKFSHEADSFLKLGADKFIGFKALILKLK